MYMYMFCRISFFFGTQTTRNISDKKPTDSRSLKYFKQSKHGYKYFTLKSIATILY